MKLKIRIYYLLNYRKVFKIHLKISLFIQKIQLLKLKMTILKVLIQSLYVMMKIKFYIPLKI